MFLPLLALVAVAQPAPPSPATDPSADRALAAQPAAASDLAVIVSACVTSVRDRAGLPTGEGWEVGISATGSPMGAAAMQRRDVQGMMAGMRHSRRLLYRSGHKGFVTRYFSAGEPYACQATIVADEANLDALRRQIVRNLGLGNPGSPDAAVTSFAGQYLLGDMNEIYRKDGSTFVVHADTTDRLLWHPDTAQPTISIIVF